MQRLVAQLRELGAPPGAAAHGAVVEDRADDVDFLAVVDLVPERLQHLADRRRVGVAAVHQARDVLEADVAGLQLFVVQHADAAVARDLVAVEREVHFLDAVALGARAELRLGARRAAAEENALVTVHCASPASCDHSIRRWTLQPTLPRRRVDRGLLPRLQDRPDAHGGRRRRRRPADPRRLRLLPQRAQLPRRRPDRRRPAGRREPRPTRRAHDARRRRSRAAAPSREPFPIVSDRERTGPPMTPDRDADLELLLRRIIREETGITPVVPADKWRGGTLVLRPGTPGLQEKTLADRNVLSQGRDAAEPPADARAAGQRAELPDDVKVKLQGYISGCYGSLTSFNVLFADEDDQFKGAGGD